jgi:hypothetical protein
MVVERLWNGCGMVVERLSKDRWNGCRNGCWTGWVGTVVERNGPRPRQHVVELLQGHAVEAEPGADGAPPFGVCRVRGGRRLRHVDVGEGHPAAAPRGTGVREEQAMGQPA